MSLISAWTIALVATLALVRSVRSPWLKILIALAGAFLVKLRPGLDPLQIYFLIALGAGYAIGSSKLVNRRAGAVIAFLAAVLIFEALNAFAYAR